MEPASGRRVDGAGNIALDAALFFLSCQTGISDGDTAQQSLGVRVQRMGIDFVCLAQLHHLSQIHDTHIVRHVAHHGKIMGDEQVGNLLFLLKIFQQVDDLGLDGHIQCGNGLVTDDQLGLQHQCPGDADTLSLAAGKLMGVPVGMLLGQAHPLQHGIDDVVGLFLTADHTVGDEWLGNDVPHSHSGIEGRIRILEDHLHFPPVGL